MAIYVVHGYMDCVMCNRFIQAKQINAQFGINKTLKLEEKKLYFFCSIFCFMEYEKHIG